MTPEQPATTTAAAIADAISMGSGVTVVEADDPAGELEDFEEELRYQLEPEALLVVPGGSTARQFLNRTADEKAALLIEGLSSMTDPELQGLDLGRNRMQRDAPLVFFLAAEDGRRLRRCAPNLSSLIGGRWFHLISSSADQSTSNRLASLRTELGYRDEDLIEEVRRGHISVDPRVAEWLALIGRGDLIDRD